MRLANATACWPVPLPISRTLPVWSSRRFSSTDEIAAWLRWNAAASSRPSSGGGPSFPNSMVNSGIDDPSGHAYCFLLRHRFCEAQIDIGAGRRRLLDVAGGEQGVAHPLGGAVGNPAVRHEGLDLHADVPGLERVVEARLRGIRQHLRYLLPVRRIGHIAHRLVVGADEGQQFLLVRLRPIVVD